MRRASWAAALLASGLVVRLAWADVPVRLSYRAAPGCPDQDAFVSLVRARNARIHPVDEGSSAPRYEVSVEQGEQGALGRLVLSGGSGELLREVRAGRCDEVADALALVLALSLEPPAALSAPAPPPPLASSAAPASSAALSAAPSVAPPAAPPAARPAPAGARWGVGVAGSLRAGVASGWMGGGGLSVERWTARSLLRARASFESSGTIKVDDIDQGTVRVRLAAARLDACGWPLGLTSALSLWPCVGLEGGVLTAQGGGVARPGSASGAWAAAHGLGLLRWSISPRLAAEVEGGPSVALTRHRFVFEQPERVAARPALLGGAAAVGVVVTIP